MHHESEFRAVSTAELAQMGAGKVAYVRRLLGREIDEAFPGTVEIEPDAVVWALFSADGSPIVLAHEAGDALSAAFHNDLTPLAVH